MTGLPGHVGGFAAIVTTPLGGTSTHVMASDRNSNQQETNGLVAQTTTRLGSWVRKKIDDLSCSAAPVVGRKGKRPPHLLKNGPKAGYFDYAAFGKYTAEKRRRVALGEPPPAKHSAEVGESPGGCEIPAQRQDPAQRGRRRNPDRVGARSREGRRPGRARPDHGFAAEPAARTRSRSNRSGPGRHQAGRGEDP